MTPIERISLVLAIFAAFGTFFTIASILHLNYLQFGVFLALIAIFIIYIYKFFKKDKNIDFYYYIQFALFIIVIFFIIGLNMPHLAKAEIYEPKHLSSVVSPFTIRGSLSGEYPDDLKYPWLYAALEKNGPGYPKGPISPSPDGSWEDEIGFSEMEINKTIWIFVILVDEKGDVEARQIREEYDRTGFFPDKPFPLNHRKIGEIQVSIVGANNSSQPRNTISRMNIEIFNISNEINNFFKILF